MMSKEIVSDGNDFIVEQVDRSFGGSRKVALSVSGKDGSVLMQSAVYHNANRPAAALFAKGMFIFNADDNAPNFSDGTAWRDAMGNLT
jgi:hypothetical protein